MLQSAPNVWYNIDELYTISNQGTIELNTMDNKDRMSATTSTDSHQKNNICYKATVQDSPGATKISCTQKIIKNSKIDFLRHVLDTERTMTERFIWSTIIIIIAMLAIIIGTCIKKILAHEPVLKSKFIRPVLSESYVPVSQIYFPAVTVCPQNKIYKQPTRQNSRITDSITHEDTNRLEESELRKMLCDSPQDMDETSSPPQQRTSRSADGSLMTRALRFSPQSKNFMDSCKFGNEQCFNEFEKTVTEEGLCFTFNGFNPRDLFNHSLVLPMQEDTIQSDNGEKHYRYMTAGASLPLVTSLTSTLTRSSGRSDLQLTSNPRRAASHLQYLTLDLFTINEFAEDSCRADAGFKIFVHDPETPAHTSTAAAVYEVAMDNEMTVTIAPTQFSTDAAAAGTDAYRCHVWRNHHLSQNAHNNILDQLERQELQRFKFYSKANCQYDVIAEFMEKCAGCVPFYFPRKMNSVICNSTNRLRLEQCKDELSSSDIIKHCIPGCEHVSYSISSSQKYYRWTVEHKIRKYTAYHVCRTYCLLSSRRVSTGLFLMKMRISPKFPSAGCGTIPFVGSTGNQIIFGRLLKMDAWHPKACYSRMSRVIIRFNDQYAVLKRWTEESLKGETWVNMETHALVLFVLVIVSVFFGISVISLAELLYSLLAIVCRKDKPQPNIVTKPDNFVTEHAIAELDIEKSTEESPTFSDDLRTFRGRDGY